MSGLPMHLARQWAMELAAAANEYAGIPLPMEGERLRVHPGYRFAEMLNDRSDDPQPERQEDDGEERFNVVGKWSNRRTRKDVYVIESCRTGKRSAFVRDMHSEFDYALKTLGCVPAWDIVAEGKAIEKLRSLVNEHQMNCYVMAGGFIERSEKSGVVYWFRRLRPTLAMRDLPDGGARTLAGLCMHPIGYYEDSFAGSLVPTDDVIAHLVMMRGDEHGFWRRASQHAAWKPQAGGGAGS